MQADGAYQRYANVHYRSAKYYASGTFERHVTRYDWPMYREIGRIRAGESYRVAAPLRKIAAASNIS